MSTYFFSAPGRTEISGNHTDHQHGCVLAAAVNLETVAEVLVMDDPTIIIHSEGYPSVEIDLNDLEIHSDEMNSTKALVRGVAASFAQRGAELKATDWYYKLSQDTDYIRRHRIKKEIPKYKRTGREEQIMFFLSLSPVFEPVATTVFFFC